MSIEPIPLELLIHEIENVETIDDGYDRKPGEPVKIKNVRVVYNEKFVKSSDSKGTNYSHKVFMDREYTKPFKELKKESEVLWNNKKYTVVACNPIYDFDSVPHHYEVELV